MPEPMDIFEIMGIRDKMLDMEERIDYLERENTELENMNTELSNDLVEAKEKIYKLAHLISGVEKITN